MPVGRGLPWHLVATGLAGHAIPFVVAAPHAHTLPSPPFFFFLHSDTGEFCQQATVCIGTMAKEYVQSEGLATRVDTDEVCPWDSGVQRGRLSI